MSKAVRVLTVTILPLLTLLLGVQLGSQYQAQESHKTCNALEYQYTGNVGSGTLLGDPEEEVDIALLWTVWRLLQQHHIAPDTLKVQPMLYNAVGGLVKGIDDPYSVFMTPSQNKDFRDTLLGKLQGIGAELTYRDEKIVVVSPLKGSPAEGVGLRPEDVIISVDGESIEGEGLMEVVQRIRGPKGTDVTIGVIREGEGETLEFTITRDDIKVPSTEYEVQETGSGTIGYISINQFGERTTREVREAMELFQAEEEPITALVVDVRFNGGGYLDRAVELVSMFLRQGKVVSVERRDGEPEVHYVFGRPIDTETPMVILINEGSASASEIFAGALQDHGRATIVGKKSFGKGTIQEIFDLPGGSSLRVTVAKWLTPNGRDLGTEGVEPDIDVDRTIADLENDRDPQMLTALEWILDGQDISEQFAVVEEDAEEAAEETE